MSTRAIRLLVSGTVQGVGYRDWAVREATALALTGWVRNLADGRVEIWAEGAAESLASLRVRAAEGPRFADVTQVVSDPAVPRGVVGFGRRPTATEPEAELTAPGR